MRLKTFFKKFEQFAEAPNAVAKMRELVLEMAVQGKLVEQDSNETHAEETLRQVTRAVRPIFVNYERPVPTGWVSIPLGCVIASNTGGGTPSKHNSAYWCAPCVRIVVASLPKFCVNLGALKRGRL